MTMTDFGGHIWHELLFEPLLEVLGIHFYEAPNVTKVVSIYIY